MFVDFFGFSLSPVRGTKPDVAQSTPLKLFAWGAASLTCLTAHTCLSCALFQTISIVYIVTSIVGVEAWYAPFLFNFLYRDLFTAMIIGKKLHVEACLLNSTFLITPNVLMI